MNKNLAEEIRNLMNKMEEAAQRHYDLVIPEVENWVQPTDPDDESFPYYINLGVNYSIVGKYIPARIRYDDYDHPAEYPELDEFAVYNADTGEELTNIPNQVIDMIEQEIWDDAESKKADYDPSYDDDDRDYYR
jgi:hypothetical protein